MGKGKLKIQSILGPETRFEGMLHSNGIIRIDGLVTGDVAEADEVIVGETGKIEGDIKAKSVVVAGHVMGNITASNSIKMLPNSRVYGAINTPLLSIYEGVVFQGNCTMNGENPFFKKQKDKTPIIRGRIIPCIGTNCYKKNKLGRDNPTYLGYERVIRYLAMKALHKI